MIRLMVSFVLGCMAMFSYADSIDYQAAVAAIHQPEHILIDVRSPPEWQAEGTIDGALQIAHTDIAEQISAVTTDKQALIVLYCRSGNRSGMAQAILQQLGYKQVINGGGYQALKQELDRSSP